MDRSVFANYPPALSAEQQKFLVSAARDWTIRHGLAVRPSPAFVQPEVDPHHVLATNAPVTLFPSPFPRSGYETAVSVQTAYNELYARISRDEAWLGKIIEE
jgi:glutathione synthase